MEDDGDEDKQGSRGEGILSCYSGKGKQRQDNSLGVLTKDFIKRINHFPEKTIDINEAVGLLKVQKRRIYDITNVLEGIGYIEKQSKNKIKWVGKNEENNYMEEMNELTNKIKSLENEEATIEHLITEVISSKSRYKARLTI